MMPSVSFYFQKPHICDSFVQKLTIKLQSMLGWSSLQVQQTPKMQESKASERL